VGPHRDRDRNAQDLGQLVDLAFVQMGDGLDVGTAIAVLDAVELHCDPDSAIGAYARALEQRVIRDTVPFTNGDFRAFECACVGQKVKKCECTINIHSVVNGKRRKRDVCPAK